MCLTSSMVLALAVPPKTEVYGKADAPFLDIYCFILSGLPPKEGLIRRKGDLLYLVNGPVIKKVVERQNSTGQFGTAWRQELVEQIELLRCWEGEHVSIGMLAAFVLCTYVIGYPIATCVSFKMRSGVCMDI